MLKRDLSSKAQALAGLSRGMREAIGSAFATASEEVNGGQRAGTDRAYDAMRNLLADVSHDLRTPVGTIRLVTEVLRRSGLTADQREALDQIDACVAAQSRLIEDILDVTRIAHGKLSVALRPMDLMPALAAAVSAVAPVARQHGVTLVLGGRPRRGKRQSPRHTSLPILGDALRLQQVCWNLLTNAVKFSPRGSKVHLQAWGDTAGVHVHVVDRGVGIDARFLPHVFDRLAQAPAAAGQRRAGLGLGLAIARHIVEAHGGRIDALSDGPGQGTTLTVTLPHAPSPMHDGASDTRRAAGDEDAAYAAALPSLKGVRALLVGEAAKPRETMELLLGLRGARVEPASTAEEGWRLFLAWRPQVLVGEVGVNDAATVLLRRIRRLSPGAGGATPAIAVWAHDAPSGRHASGFDRQVPAAYEPTQLLKTISAMAGVPGSKGPSSN